MTGLIPTCHSKISSISLLSLSNSNVWILNIVLISVVSKFCVVNESHLIKRYNVYFLFCCKWGIRIDPSLTPVFSDKFFFSLDCFAFFMLPLLRNYLEKPLKFIHNTNGPKNSVKFIASEVTLAHRGAAVSLATYHRDIKTFQWTRPLSSWFCPSWHCAKRDVCCKTISGGTLAEAQRNNTVWGCFSFRDHGACLLWYSLHSFTDVFIYLWIWLSNQQRIHISLPHEEPCHIYIFLIAYNSNSPGLTCPIKKMQHFAWHITFSPKPLDVCPINPSLSPASWWLSLQCMFKFTGSRCLCWTI